MEMIPPEGAAAPELDQTPPEGAAPPWLDAAPPNLDNTTPEDTTTPPKPDDNPRLTDAPPNLDNDRLDESANATRSENATHGLRATLADIGEGIVKVLLGLIIAAVVLALAVSCGAVIVSAQREFERKRHWCEEEQHGTFVELSETNVKVMPGEGPSAGPKIGLEVTSK